MKVVTGIDGLATEHGRLFVVLGVFDGLHLGHLYMLRELVRAAATHDAQPAVITFDHHPDEILAGSAPPLLCDPAERMARLADAGVALTVVDHFDLRTRMTPYDAYVRHIASRVDLAGFLMTPESAFGFERGGTPETVAALGRELGYEVIVVPTLELEGRPVRSAEIRGDIARGDLASAAALLGRPYAVVGDSRGGSGLDFAMPVALPADGSYPVTVDSAATTARIADGRLRLEDGIARYGPTRVVFALPSGARLARASADREASRSG